jgi:hypothetical protein
MKLTLPAPLKKAFAAVRSCAWLSGLLLIGAGLAGWLVSLAAYPAPLVSGNRRWRSSSACRRPKRRNHSSSRDSR